MRHFTTVFIHALVTQLAGQSLPLPRKLHLYGCKNDILGKFGKCNCCIRSVIRRRGLGMCLQQVPRSKHPPYAHGSWNLPLLDRFLPMYPSRSDGVAKARSSSPAIPLSFSSIYCTFSNSWHRFSISSGPRGLYLDSKPCTPNERNNLSLAARFFALQVS